MDKTKQNIELHEKLDTPIVCLVLFTKKKFVGRFGGLRLAQASKN